MRNPSGNLRDLLQLLSPSERIGYATKWSGTRIKDSTVFSFEEDQGISPLIYFASIALVTLFPPLPPTILVLPREPDVASTLANQLATRMRPPRLNFNVPEDSIHRHAVSSLLTVRVRVSSIREKPSSLIYVPPASISNRFLVA